MTNLQTQQQQPMTIKSLFARVDVKEKFTEMLGKRSTAFMTSVLQIVSQNEHLKGADPNSIYHAAAVAATLDLPLNNNLGFAYIVPYKGNAQFQMGYKGFIQLALRSGQFKTISCTPIYEGQLVQENPLTGFVFDFTKSGKTIIGYASYFQLLNGFEKTLYMSIDQVKAHGKKFSQTYKKNFGLWVDDFDSMAQKTVTKLLLSKYAPLSVEMQKAVIADQGIIKDHYTMDTEYIDNSEIVVDKEEERIVLMLQDCKTGLEVDAIQVKNPNIDVKVFDARKEEIKHGN